MRSCNLKEELRKFNSPQIDRTDEIVINELLSNYKNSINAYEIGSWTGSSARVICAHIKTYGGHINLVDDFSGSGSKLSEYVGVKDVRSTLEENLKEFNGLFTIVEKRSDNAFKDVPDNSIDFLFIDGDHRYTQCRRDLDNWWPKIKTGGMICGHDCEYKEWDEKYIEYDCMGDRHHGVCKAVTEKFPNSIIKHRIWSQVK